MKKTLQKVAKSKKEFFGESSYRMIPNRYKLYPDFFS